MGLGDELLTEEERAILETVSQFRKKELENVALEIDETPEPEKISDLFKSAASIGMCSCLSCASGGASAGLSELTLGLREIAYASPGFAVLILSHNVALLALEHTSKDADLGAFGRGEKRAAFAASILKGEGTLEAGIVPGGWNADVIVFHVFDDAFVYPVEKTDARLKLEKIENPLGFRASLPARAWLSVAQHVEGGTEISSEFSETLQCALLLGLASVASGITRRALDVSHSYAKERYQGGDYIIGHEQMRIYLAEMALGIQISDAAIQHAKDVWMKRGQALSACKAAKCAASRFAMSSALNGVQIHGGYGYMRDYGTERLMREAKYCQSYPKAEQEELLDIVGIFPERVASQRAAGRDLCKGGF